MSFYKRAEFFRAGLLFFSILCVWSTAIGSDASSSLKPDLFITMSEGEESEYAIVVEKETQKLALFRFNGGYEQVLNLRCSTGEVAGMKTRSGDKKTPEGVYFFTGAFERKYLSPVYGEMAFPMDYPNLIDRMNGREGNSIWMHGTNKKIKDRDSNGCIVLANADIRELSKYITINRTPIIVTDKIRYTALDEDQRTKKQLFVFLDQWNNALMQGGYEQYLAFYKPGVISKMPWWNEWASFRDDMQQAGIPARIQMDKLLLLKYDGVYTALFEQVLQLGEKVRNAGTRKVYLETRGDAVQIIGDTYQSSDARQARDEVYPFIRSCRELKALHYARQEIESLVDRWLRAWNNKDLETYIDCYASDFRFRWMDRDDWRKKKKRLNQKYKTISVTKENLVINTGEKRSSARFLQRYESSGYRAIGIKKLIFKLENGQWKIFRERWKKS